MISSRKKYYRTEQIHSCLLKINYCNYINDGFGCDKFTICNDCKVIYNYYSVQPCGCCQTVNHHCCDCHNKTNIDNHKCPLKKIVVDLMFLFMMIQN